MSRDQRLICLVLLAWFAIGAMVPMQNDSWWHLRTGEIIWRNQAVPLVDPFSWVLRPGTFWPNHEWLSQLTFYCLYSLGGLALVNMVLGVLVACGAALIVGAMKGPLRVRALVLILMLPWIFKSLVVRPQLFTLFFLALTLYLIRRDKAFLFPPLFLLWVQFHVGAISGVVSLGAASLAALWTHRERARSFIMWSGLATACVILNPLGLKAFAYPFESILKAEALPLIEWQAPRFSGVLQLYFWGCLVLLTTLCIRYRRELWKWPSSAYLLIGIFFQVLACRHLRDISLWTVVAGVLCSYFPAASGERAAIVVRKRYAVEVAISAVATFSLVIWCLTHPVSRLAWYPISEQGLRALRASPEPQFNSYDLGGYLIWFVPERKVFIDSRQVPYPTGFLQDAIRVQTSGDFEEFFKVFGFRSAVVEDWMPLTDALIKHQWRVTYRGRTFTLLERPEPQ